MNILPIGWWLGVLSCLAAGWSVRKTVSGLVYYENSNTNRTTMERPIASTVPDPEPGSSAMLEAFPEPGSSAMLKAFARSTDEHKKHSGPQPTVKQAWSTDEDKKKREPQQPCTVKHALSCSSINPDSCIGGPDSLAAIAARPSNSGSAHDGRPTRSVSSPTRSIPSTSVRPVMDNIAQHHEMVEQDPAPEKALLRGRAENRDVMQRALSRCLKGRFIPFAAFFVVARLELQFARSISFRPCLVRTQV